METSLAEDVKKPTRTLSPDSFFFMSPYRSFTTSGCFRRFSQPAVGGDALNGEFAEVSEKALKSLKIKGGAVVTGVHEGGLLDKAGIRRGSVITRINNSTISSVNDLNRITSAIESIEWINPDGTRDRLLIMPK